MAEARYNSFGDLIVEPANSRPQPQPASTGRRATDSEFNMFGDRRVGSVRPPSAQQATSFYQSILAGAQISASGLVARRALPEYEMPVNAPWYNRAAYGVANVVTDLPLSVVAGVGGFAAGTAIAAPTGPGAAIGGMVGAGAAGFGVPMSIRDALVTAYNHDNAMSWAGVWEIAKSAGLGLAKGSVVGGLVGPAGAAVRAGAAVAGGGGKAGFAVAAAGKAPVTAGREAAALGAELTTMVGVGSALDGHMPSAQDFLDNAILLGGLKVAVTTARRMRNTYAETGKSPNEIYGDAIRDPEIRSDLTGEPMLRGVPVAKMAETLKRDFPEVDMRFTTKEDGAILLQEIEAKRTGEGLGHAPMEEFTRWLDENGKRSTLIAAEMGEVKESSLVEFYKKHGYAVDELQDYPGSGVKMTREPNLEVKQGRPVAEGVPAEAVPEAPRTLGIPRAYDALALEQRVKAAVESDPRPEAVRKIVSGEKEWVPLGDAPIKDGVKYEYMVDGESARAITRAVQGQYEAALDAQTRGVVSNKQTAVEALQLIAQGPIAPHIIGQSATAAEIFARAHLLRGATAHAVAEIKKIASIPEAELTPALKLQALANIERVAMLYGEVKGVGAEAGRALQIHRAIKRDSTMLDEAQFLIAAAERKGSLQDLAALLEPLKDAGGAAKFLNEYRQASTLEKVLEAWKASILSGPQTHLANMIGNGTRWLVEVPEAMLSTAYFAAVKAAKGEALTKEQFKARAFAPIIGWQLGAADGLKVAAEVWRGRGEHLEKGDLFRPAIEGKVGDVIRTPFKVLQMGDVLFRTPGERAEAYIMAVDRAVKEGLHPETREWSAAVANWVQNPADGLSDVAGAKALARVQEAGAKMVFSEKLGPTMTAWQAGLHTKHGMWAQFIVPFFRTPVNLLSYAIQHTPGLNLLSSRWRNDFAAGGESRAKALARVTVGTGIAMTAFALAEADLITGSGQFDKELSGTKRGAGRQPYSINIGGTWYSYQRIEPIAKVVGMAADLVEMINATEKEEDKSKMALMLVGLLGNATISSTYLSGLSSTLQAATDPTRYAPHFLEQYASSLVPKIIGQSVAAFDPHKREVDSALDAIKSQLPYFRSQLMPARDVWGEPRENSKFFAILPIATSEASRDLVKTEAVRLAIGIADAPKNVFEKGPLNRKDKAIKLDPEQRDIFKEVAGKEAMDILAPIVNHPDWNQIPEFKQVDIYKDAFRNARKMATQEAVPADSEVREEKREKIQQKIIDQIDKAAERN